MFFLYFDYEFMELLVTIIDLPLYTLTEMLAVCNDIPFPKNILLTVQPLTDKEHKLQNIVIFGAL